MIISKIYNKLDKDKKEELFFGLFFGLFYGLVYGLVYGLFFGLFYGLVIGLFSGLAYGLVIGLVYGLFSGLVIGLFSGLFSGLVIILINFSEALPFINGFFPILFLTLGIIFLVELFYWLSPKEKVKKKDLFWYTCKRKAEVLFEVLLGLSLIAQIYILIREIDFVKYFPEILKWIGYIGTGIICLGLLMGIIYLWIKLNSLKWKVKK